jgi:pSer/pThr/pTyr-binding forkhead associated (FHA) protein
MGAAGTTQDRTQVMPGGMQATMVMPGQADAFRTQMGGTTICGICGSTTPLMDPYCGDCGFLLSSAVAADAAPPVEETPPAELVDPQTGRRFRLHAGVNTLGRQGTDILINEGTVSRNHATLTVENGGVIVEDLGSSNGTKVGSQRLSANQPVRANPGDNLRFGNWNVTLTMSGAAADSATIAMPASADATILAPAAFSSEDTFVASNLPTPSELAQPSESVEPVSGGAMVGTLRRIEGPGDDIAVTEGVISIGRRPENTVVLSDDAYVSGRHAQIITDSTGVYIVDIGSTNGTVVNGAKIAANERLSLSEGDELHIGQNKFRYEPLANDGGDDAADSADSVLEDAPETETA